MEFAARGKDIELDIDIHDDIGAIVGDRNRLQQVIWNLLSNAVKFTPKGGRVQVEARRDNSEALLKVTDSGQGIAIQDLPHVFERFWQADASKSRSSGGLGLGLAIVRHIVEAHGGQVAVDSPGEGKGTSFSVRLPIQPIKQEGRVEKLSEALPTESGADLINGRLQGRTILALDDQVDALALVTRSLSMAGATVASASSGEEALKIFEQQEFDVVVSDVGMPGMSGYKFMRTLRQREIKLARLKTPSIALTAYAGKADIREALEEGFDAHLGKPISPVRLIEEIIRLLESSTT